MVGSAENAQLIVAPGDHLQVRVLQLSFDNAHVQLEVVNPLRDGSGVLHRQHHPGTGMNTHEAGHDRHHQVVADGQRGPHLDLAHFVVARQTALQLAGLRQQ